MNNPVKVPVSKRALVARINRRLKSQVDAQRREWADYEALKATRGQLGRSDLGDFYMVNVAKNCVIDTHLDIEVLARSMGILQAWEEVQ